MLNMLTYVTDDHMNLIKDYSSHAWEIGGIYIIWTLIAMSTDESMNQTFFNPLI